jgi:hypothetical protein
VEPVAAEPVAAEPVAAAAAVAAAVAAVAEWGAAARHSNPNENNKDCSIVCVCVYLYTCLYTLVPAWVHVSAVHGFFEAVVFGGGLLRSS